MKHLILCLSILMASTFGAHAQSSEIQTVIGGQIDALKQDDFERAFSFATPNIKRIFGDVKRFEQMVTNGYPMVHRPASVTFKDMKKIDGILFQYVLIEDQQGRAFIAEYAMIETDMGWKINGVQIKPRDDIGA